MSVAGGTSIDTDTAGNSGSTTPTAAPAGGNDLHAAARELLGAGNRLQWSDDAGTLELRAGVGQKHAAGLPCLRLEHGATQLRVALEHERPGDASTDDAHWRDYQDDARALAWTLEHEGLIETLAQIFSNPVLASGFLPRGGSDCLWLAMDYRATNGATAEGWLGIGAAEARRLASVAAWQRDPGRLAMLGDATSVPLVLWMPGVAMQASDIDAIAPGDVLLAGPAQDAVAQLRPDREAARDIFGLPEAWCARHRHGQWELAEPAALTRTDEPARPHFLLTRFSVPLDDVAAWQPGALLTCDSLLAGSTVGIVLGGRRFGEGTLVTLGDLIGVRIDHREAPHGFQ